MLTFIYNHSPIFFQNIMVSIQGKIFIKQRYTKYYYKELETLRNCTDKDKLQQERLNEFYNFIKNNSCYYKDKLQEYSSNIDIENIEEFPLLTKENIRENLDELVTKKKDLIKLGTGGTTGKSMYFYTDAYDMSRKIASLDYYKEKHNIYKGMRRVSVGGKKIIPKKQKKNVFWRYNKPLNQLLISAYHANGENLKYYVEKINDFKPETIDGYATVLHRISKYIVNNNIKLSFKPVAIFPTSETLTDEMKEDIKRAFNCPVRNQYGSQEGAPFIAENEKGNLEIDVTSGVFELKHIQDEIYELIVTGFYTTTTPLFRYMIGDSVELYEKLPKNYTQKDIKIKRIIGRNGDFLKSKDKGIVTHVNLASAIRIAGGNQIIESQFVQSKLDRVNIFLVLSKDAKEKKIIDTLTKELEVRMGKNTQFKFRIVDEIPQTKGGKKRFTINNIK